MVQQKSIPTSLRMLSIIEQYAISGNPLSPSELNKTLGLPIPTIHRLCALLETEGYLQRDFGTRAYLPGQRLSAIANGVFTSTRILMQRRAILEQLAENIGETCNIAIPDTNTMIYLERVETDWPLRIQLPTGTKVPLYCTASGKLYLSSVKPNHLKQYVETITFEQKSSNTITDKTAFVDEISRIRKQGFALDKEEFMHGMIALAVPILDQQNRLLATLSFHAPTLRFTETKALEQLKGLQQASKSLSELL